MFSNVEVLLRSSKSEIHRIHTLTLIFNIFCVTSHGSIKLGTCWLYAQSSIRIERVFYLVNPFSEYKVVVLSSWATFIYRRRASICSLYLQVYSYQSGNAGKEMKCMQALTPEKKKLIKVYTYDIYIYTYSFGKVWQ